MQPENPIVPGMLVTRGGGDGVQSDLSANSAEERQSQDEYRARLNREKLDQCVKNCAGQMKQTIRNTFFIHSPWPQKNFFEYSSKKGSFCQTILDKWDVPAFYREDVWRELNTSSKKRDRETLMGVFSARRSNIPKVFRTKICRKFQLFVLLFSGHTGFHFALTYALFPYQKYK